MFTRIHIPAPATPAKWDMRRSADLAIKRVQAPIIEIATGKQWYCASDTIKRVNELWGTHHCQDWIRQQTFRYKGNGVVLTNHRGWRFVRLERHDGDERAPIYFDWDSIK